MNKAPAQRGKAELWGPYVNYDDVARLEYSRLLWRQPETRARLQQHWLDERHPNRARYLRWRALVDEILEATQADDALDESLRDRGSSLRAVTREIPSVFGSFFPASSKQALKLRAGGATATAGPL